MNPQEQKVQNLSEEISSLSQKIQKDVVEKLGVTDYHTMCMTRCQPQIDQAQRLMEARNQKMQGSVYTLDKHEFFERKLTKIDDALMVERANFCMDKCKQPVDIVKRVLAANMKQINTNIQECMKTTRIIDQQSNLTKIDFDRAEVCLTKNIEIMHLVNKKLNSGMLKFKDEFMV